MMCPCHSGKKYADCCEPFHKGSMPHNALDLMKSRYSAYACCLPEYIMETTHPSHHDYQKDKSIWKQEILSFSRVTSFEDLIILGFEEDKEHAVVEFKATLSQNQLDVSFIEKSLFEKVKDRWFYKRAISLKQA